MIEQAFQELLNDYLATKHRKRIEIITKAFNSPTRHIKASNDAGGTVYHAPHRRSEDCVQ